MHIVTARLSLVVEHVIDATVTSAGQLTAVIPTMAFKVWSSLVLSRNKIVSEAIPYIFADIRCLL